ncbi:hypothetical protein [Aliishimia ponticola]|uniref:hypothetical protein n=1 Tax=Aliishimia ponticola TaxID=2499833 RepID=UPI00145611E4|nr:hypothetical protein [Aliishimia ponticola]
MIDLNEIARGRRITAVTAKELDLTPRHSERPRFSMSLRRLSRRGVMLLRRIVGQPAQR